MECLTKIIWEANPVSNNLNAHRHIRIPMMNLKSYVIQAIFKWRLLISTGTHTDKKFKTKSYVLPSTSQGKFDSNLKVIRDFRVKLEIQNGGDSQEFLSNHMAVTEQGISLASPPVTMISMGSVGLYRFFPSYYYAKAPRGWAGPRFEEEEKNKQSYKAF